MNTIFLLSVFQERFYERDGIMSENRVTAQKGKRKDLDVSKHFKFLHPKLYLHIYKIL